jgi:hypothetical protein
LEIQGGDYACHALRWGVDELKERLEKEGIKLVRHQKGDTQDRHLWLPDSARDQRSKESFARQIRPSRDVDRCHCGFKRCIACGMEIMALSKNQRTWNGSGSGIDRAIVLMKLYMDARESGAQRKPDPAHTRRHKVE